MLFDYLINFVLHIEWLLPPIRRAQRFKTWLYALLKPLEQLHDAPNSLNEVKLPDCSPVVPISFTAFVLYIRTIMSINGQQIQLERYLNSYYYNFYNPNSVIQLLGRRIYIVDNVSNYTYSFLWQKNENKPLATYKRSDYLAPPPTPTNGSNTLAGPQYLYQNSEYITPFDFKVFVPVAFLATNTIIELQTQINQFKQAGTTYQILTY